MTEQLTNIGRITFRVRKSVVLLKSLNESVLLELASCELNSADVDHEFL